MSPFIPAIYHYCDRCCAQCSFSGRCAVFAGSAVLDSAGLDPGNEGFWKGLLEQFCAAHPDFPREAIGSVEVRPPTDAELEEARRRQEAAAARLQEEAAWRSADTYVQSFFALMEDTAFWRAKARAAAQQAGLGIRSPREALAEAGRVTDCLHALRLRAGVASDRLREALLGGVSSGEEAASPDGLAKVALLCLEQSHRALATLYAIFPDEDRVLPLFGQLARARRDVERRFPDAWAFVRPGFDEPATALLPAGEA